VTGASGSPRAGDGRAFRREHGRRDAGLLAVVSVAVLAFAAVAAIVATGGLDGVDTYAARHLMPGLRPRSTASSLLEDVLPYHGGGFTVGDAIRIPAGLFASVLLVGGMAAYLWRQSRRRAAGIWLGLFLVASAIEVVCKRVVTRPSIDVPAHGVFVHVVGFDSSYPSGHLLRAAVLVMIAAWFWPASRLAGAAWLVGVAVTLELDGRHTPSDLLGALLLASGLGALTLLLVRMSTPVMHEARTSGSLDTGRSARDD